MDRQYTRSFASPDELAEATNVRSEVVYVGGMTISRDVQLPGWRWSVDVKPLVGTEWCQLRHIEYAVRGRLHVLLQDGYEFEVAPGDVAAIPAGHDAWVVGDEPFESIAWSGVRGWMGSLEVGLERVLVTLVMTDIVGSTPLAKRLGDRIWGELIGQYMDGASNTIRRYRGQLVALTGDGVQARFDGAIRAIHCAVALRAEAVDLDIPTRTVVHTGEVEVAEGTLHGVALHEAARMLALAAENEILLSATTRSLATEPGLVFDDRGEHELRGLPGSYRIYALRPPDHERARRAQEVRRDGQ